MIFLHYDKKTKEILGSYDETFKEIPLPNFEISLEDWNNAQINDHNAIENNKTFYKDFTTEEEKTINFNNKIFLELEKIDKKKVRAISDFIVTNDKTRLLELEEQANALRKTIKK